MNKHGQAARFAYNPEAVLAYLDFLDEKDALGWSKNLNREERRGWTDAVHGRTVRRWKKAKGITAAGLNTVLACYPGIGEGEFVKWAEANGYAPILRNR